MAGKKEKNTILIDDVEHNFEDLTNEQQIIVNHIADLQRKIQSSEFNLQQLVFGKDAFISALKSSIEKEKSTDDKPVEVVEAG